MGVKKEENYSQICVYNSSSVISVISGTGQ
jgi:hypothetical protein